MDIIDNACYSEDTDFSAWDWLDKYFDEEGKIDIVTGYFTVGAMNKLCSEKNDKIQKMRMIVGDISGQDKDISLIMNLVNEELGIEAALEKKQKAEKVVDFLNQKKVEIKTIEPNFCHAKAYIYKSLKDARHNFFLMGSSNFTEAGLGLRKIRNMELNIGNTGSDTRKFLSWFDKLWKSDEARHYKTLKDEKGRERKVNFKEYLIELIQSIFKEYTPEDIFNKILYEMFNEHAFEMENDVDFQRKLGRLENSIIFKTLYDFQKQGVLSLIKILNKFNGAILADAVGLGKTFSALAVMKFYMREGFEIVLLCPKKLEHNWAKYKAYMDSIFEDDKFDYFMRFHTDLTVERMNTYTDRNDRLFLNEKPKLFVIDESHNLRNNKSKRYDFLVNEILAQTQGEVKILLLSATPINNDMNDIRNQFMILTAGDAEGFKKAMDVGNINNTFKHAQKAFNQWRVEKGNISSFIKELPDDFIKLTDNLTVARTRDMVTGSISGFPKKIKPINIYETPQNIGHFESFCDLFADFPAKLAGYQPSYYLPDTEEQKDAMKDEKSRERFLVKMMHILMVKRLESSWISFLSTIKKIRDHHQNTLNKIVAYQESKSAIILNQEEEVESLSSDVAEEMQDFEIGKKKPISIEQIDMAGTLELFQEDLESDIEALNSIVSAVRDFEAIIEYELSKKINLDKSADTKLVELMKIIKKKQESGENENNRKVLIFTVFYDTAEYLFDQLKARGFSRLAVVSGSHAKDSYSCVDSKKAEPILERFAPYTKLFKEKDWSKMPNFGRDTETDFEEWKKYIKESEPTVQEKLDKPIDILIATDAFSEGQNLQDCDMVINYDIHWNPVRIIQRMGRIDRIGSPNEKIFGVNFWPEKSIDKYLDLQERIEHRMAAMTLGGAEVNYEFTDNFKEISKSKEIERQMNQRMMRQMQDTWEDIEVSDQALGFNDLSLETFKQDLSAGYFKERERYLNMPNGIFSGCKRAETVCGKEGIMALMGYPPRKPGKSNHRYKQFELVYIDKEGNKVMQNQREILEALKYHKNYERYLPDEIENINETKVKDLSSAFCKYIKGKTAQPIEIENGKTVMAASDETLNQLELFAQGAGKKAMKNLEEGSVEKKYQLENFDLITWLLLS